jgi:predicted NAD/FAD-binding protein
MPFETPSPRPRRIAVVGAGISGLGAAHLLSANHHVTLYEAERRLGGHARTVLAGKRGDQPVDTGFIVFNRPNYPHLVRLFEKLSVPVTKSDMSFGASLRGGRIEYGLKTLNTLFTQRPNLLHPRFLGMVRDILRFNAGAARTVAPGMTVGGLIETMRLGDWFRDFYLLPLSGAIWSSPCAAILDFPADAMIRFFDNHALLQASGQHQWYTVDGGSQQYVSRLSAALDRAGVTVHQGASVTGVRRGPTGVQVRAAGGDWQDYDEVVMATHSDDTLRLLGDATAAEKAALGAIRYQPNRAVLHSDASLMPRRKGAWASWVYTEARDKADPRIDLTYWMNSLQPIPKDDPLFVTLNATRAIDPRLIHDEVEFRHPVYDRAALDAQAKVRALSGTAGVWFCGAWMKNGFHEDGLASAHDVADAMRRDPVALDIAAE